MLDSLREQELLKIRREPEWIAGLLFLIARLRRRRTQRLQGFRISPYSALSKEPRIEEGYSLNLF